MIYNLEAGLLQAVGMFEHGLSMGLMSAIYNIGSVVLQSSINQCASANRLPGWSAAGLF
ncbi:MAG: hypothetical protein ACLVAV_09530 [Clostridium sp.]|uniref:hypothetical protein n=1 Tax=Clostridium sp. AM22-11AC TaxID=2293024 RepID=UPI000A78A508|nr:hypothetical protein [Clostridium sp. AM22-11AC]MBS4792191.1 hypothetical protein [Clostridium sp.]MEE0208672.1 hypothetical protein [Enterocloster sp.]